MDTPLPETQLTDEVETEDELLPDLYVEIATNFLYEVKFFDTFALIRPATPAFYLAIRKINHLDFSRLFTEFTGDRDAARAFIKGETPDFVIDP